MAIDRVRTMTVEEYLAFEEQSEIKHEYVDGELYEMPGVTLTHAVICMNTAVSLRSQLNPSRFIVLGSDMRVGVRVGKYLYPDISVVSGAPETEYKQLTLVNPILVVEVLSQSSVYRDRIEKQELYLASPSIQHYLIIDQFSVDVELLTREGDRWRSQRFTNMNDVIHIPALDCELPVAEIYERIELD